jgi:fusarinine C synthase
MGRIGEDSQAKLRGQRFELAEVEQTVRYALPSVQQVTAAVFTPSGTGNENTRLALLFADHGRYKSNLRADQDVNIEDVPLEEALPERLREELLEVRRLLETSLPSYMVPSYWIPMQEMPRTVSGKADRKTMARWLHSLTNQQLGFFSLDRASTTPKVATNSKEEQLVELWSTVLGIDKAEISVDADFIFLGGDSIKAMRLAAASRSHGMTGLSTTAILQLRTIEALAKKIRLPGAEDPSGVAGDLLPAPFSLLRLGAASTSDAVIDAARACGVAPSAIQDLYPVTTLQKGLFTASLNSSDAYRGLFVYKLRHDVNLERLQDAWSALVSATPIIRTRLYKTPEGFFQAVIQKPVPCNVVSSRLEEHLFMEREASRAMTFGSPLYRASIAQDVGDGRLQTYFILNAHHAVCFPTLTYSFSS